MCDEEKRKISASDLKKLLGEEVGKIETEKLTAPDNDYGSFLLAVNATLTSGKHLTLIAKMFPISESAQNTFQSPTSMKKEIEVYKIISPEYEKIQEEQGVSPSQRLRIFCNSPGARLTLEDNDEVELADNNSVLLLENLKLQGYRTGDYETGLDVKHTEYVLKHLAKFHATAVAIKMKKPLVFGNKLLSILKPFKFTVGSLKEEKFCADLFIEELKKIPACYNYIDALTKLIYDEIEYRHSDKHQPSREPFATFVHNEFFTKNMVFKYKTDINEDPEDMKFLDFQKSEYGSPVADIMLLLFTCTQIGVLTGRIDHFLQLYHRTFVEWLEILGCETKIFFYERFMKEVKIVAPLKLMDILYMLTPFTVTKKDIDKFEGNHGPENYAADLNDRPTYLFKIYEAVSIYSAKQWL